MSNPVITVDLARRPVVAVSAPAQRASEITMPGIPGPAGPQGPPGPAGPPGQWVSMTQAEFEALPIKNPETLYVIIG